MDRRGRGGSGDAPGYRLEREAEDVAAVIDALGEPASVLGHSYGAVCTLEGALLTENIRRMVLYEPPLPTGHSTNPPGVLDRLHGLVDGGKLEAALELFMREVAKIPEHELAPYRRLPMWKGRIQLAPTIPRELELGRSETYDLEKFGTLQVPTLLLAGGESPAFMRRATEALDSALPNSRVVVLPGQQHVAMDLAPELFVQKVLDFLLA
jgi:pimeloyl-ACP methyl ester carboxylesterase